MALRMCLGNALRAHQMGNLAYIVVSVTKLTSYFENLYLRGSYLDKTAFYARH